MAASVRRMTPTDMPSFPCVSRTAGYFIDVCLNSTVDQQIETRPNEDAKGKESMGNGGNGHSLSHKAEKLILSAFRTNHKLFFH